MPIREGAPADVDALRRIARAAFDRIYAFFAVRGVRGAWPFLIADVDGVPAGFLVGRWFNGRPPIGYVYFIAVDSNYRRRGIARTPGHRANPRRRIAEAVRTAGRDPRLRRGDGGERRVPRIVRLPRIREGSSARPLAVVRLAWPLGRTADGARAPRGPPGPHPDRHAVTALVWQGLSTDLEKRLSRSR